MQDVHRRRVLWRGTNIAVWTVAVLALLVVANVLASRFHWRYDATFNKLYTLSDSTREVLKNLPEDVTLYGFLQDTSSEGQTLKKLLEEYERASPRVQVNIVDPEREPAVARRYEVDMINSVVVEAGDDYRKIDSFSLFGYGFAGSIEIRAEQAITRALLELSGRGGKKIYFLTGHGEVTPETGLSTLGRYLSGEALDVQTLNLLQTGKVPEDAAVVAIAGPTRDLLEEERQHLEQYVRDGGHLLILYGPLPGGRRLPQLEGLLATLGVEAQATLVVDPERAFLGQDPLSPMPLLGVHDIVDPLAQKRLALVLPGARSLKARENSGLEVTELLYTSDQAWGETDLTDEQVQRGSNDVGGPLSLAFAVSGQLGQRAQGPNAESAAPAEQGQGEQEATGARQQDEQQPAADQNRAQDDNGAGSSDEAADSEEEKEAPPVAVVVGNVNFLADQYMERVPGNADFIVNAVNWLLGAGDRLTIRPKEQGAVPMYLTPGQLAGVFYGLVVGLPVAAALTGVVIWWRRRHA